MENSDKSIGFLNADQTGGCGYYRSFLPYAELKLKEWDAVYGIPSFVEEHGFACKKPDSIDEYFCGFRIAVLKLIFEKSFIEYVENRNKFEQIVISDIDDFYPGLQKDNIAYKATSPETDLNINRDHLQTIWMKSDALITSTQFLYDYYSKIHENVFLIRNGIDIERYSIRHDNAGNTPTIGWVGSTPWRTTDLEILAPIMNSFLKKNNLWFHHVGDILGSKQVADLMQIDSNIVTKKPLVQLATYPLMFTDFDIGIVPLSKNDFNEAKSFIKGLEYVAAGIPFIASDSYEYRFLSSFGIGRVASNEDEWEKHLTDLLNPEQRKKEAENNWKLVNDLFHMRKRGIEWEKTMNMFFE